MDATQALTQQRLTTEEEAVIDAYCALVAEVGIQMWRDAQAALTPTPGMVYSVPVDAIERE